MAIKLCKCAITLVANYWLLQARQSEIGGAL